MLQVRGLAKAYPSKNGPVLALADLTFEVHRGEFISIVGPSGCGKTTMLRCLAGLQPPSSGTVSFKGRPVTRTPDEMALVFQDYRNSLMPWLTVRENVLLPLRHKKLGKVETNKLIEQSLESVSLGDFMDHHPWQLSGGMQQRVAIARALAYRPELLLMDEPFASVDAQTRADLEDLVLQLRGEYGMTIALVTHDVDEAVYLADRVVVLGNRPSVVKEEVEVHLPSPRDQVTTKELPEFGRLRGHIFRAVREQSQHKATSLTMT